MTSRIVPARVVLDASGAPFNPDYGDVYASRDGALAQARHVFLGGCSLPERWRGREQFVIVETGFGLGVNFLATWMAWRADPQRPRHLVFLSVERHPVAAQALLEFVPAELAPFAHQLAAQWPMALPGVHRCAFEDGAVELLLGFGDAAALLPRLVAGADAFFLDGFAPERNPDAWTPAVMKALARMARAQAVAATWCVARPVRDALAAAGFAVQRARGFGHKREMLTATFAPRWRVRRHEPPQPYRGERSALVVGSGLAGASVAAALAAAGWTVSVAERGSRAAAGASALPWGLLHPQVTVDDNVATRLARSGFFVALAELKRLAPSGVWRGAPLWRGEGAFVQAEDAAEAQRWSTLGAALQMPPVFARFCPADEVARDLGVAPRFGGWWFPQGAAVAAARLCAAWLDHPGITLLPSCAIDRLERQDGRWIACDHGGTRRADAAACIVASAQDAPRLLGLARAPVRCVRGRLSLVEAPALASLRATLSGGGTLLNCGDDRLAVGASYETDGSAAFAAADGEASGHAGNLQRLARLLAQPVDAVPVGMFEGARCVARDRLPMAGLVADEAAAFAGAHALRGAHPADLPRVPGLAASFAFGSRGLVLAPLAARWITAQLEGAPWPIERDLADCLDVARFLLRALRRSAVSG